MSRNHPLDADEVMGAARGLVAAYLSNQHMADAEFGSTVAKVLVDHGHEMGRETPLTALYVKDLARLAEALPYAIDEARKDDTGLTRDNEDALVVIGAGVLSLLDEAVDALSSRA